MHSVEPETNEKVLQNINNNPEKVFRLCYFLWLWSDFYFSDRALLDIFSTLKCLFIIGGETCCQFQTRVDDPVKANKISTICK